MKKIVLRFFFCLPLVVSGFFAVPHTTATIAEEVRVGADTVADDQVIVTVSAEDVSVVTRELENKHLDVVDTVQQGESTAIVVDVSQTVSADAAVAVVDAAVDTAGVQIEVDKRRRMTQVPNDSLYSLQWHHTGAIASVNTPTGWDTTTGSNAIVVAVVDSGVDTNHPDLDDNIWLNTDEIASNGIDDDHNGFVDDVHGFDFTNDTNDPSPSPDGIDEDGDTEIDGGVLHGTHVAGIIGEEGNNGIGGAGVMWDVQLMPVQVLDDEGAGYDSDIAQGIRYAADNGANIINLSLGGYGSTSVLSEAIAYAEGKGAIVIAAAGNDGEDINTNPFFPACYSNVIGVGSLGQNGTPSSFSNYGSNCVDVSAPGENIVSTFYEDASNSSFVAQYGLESGTSMAAPMVSGVAGLLAAQHSTATAAELRSLVLAAIEPVSGLSSQYGSGVIDASKLNNQIILSAVKGYASSKKKTTFKNDVVYAVSKPYFEWSTVVDAAAYYVYIGTNQNANPVTAGTRTTAKHITPSKALTGDEKTYYVRVQAETASGEFSNILTYTYIVDTVVKAPAKPSAKQQAKAAAVKVVWKPVKNQNVVKYEVLRQKKGSKKRDLVRKTTTTSYVDKAVVKGTTYQYSVKSVDDLGNKKESAKTTVKVK